MTGVEEHRTLQALVNEYIRTTTPKDETQDRSDLHDFVKWLESNTDNDMVRLTEPTKPRLVRKEIVNWTDGGYPRVDAVDVDGQHRLDVPPFDRIHGYIIQSPTEERANKSDLLDPDVDYLTRQSTILSHTPVVFWNRDIRAWVDLPDIENVLAGRVVRVLASEVIVERLRG